MLDDLNWKNQNLKVKIFMPARLYPVSSISNPQGPHLTSMNYTKLIASGSEIVAGLLYGELAPQRLF